MSPRHDTDVIKETLNKASVIRDENIGLSRKVLDLERANQDLENQNQILQLEISKLDQSGGADRVHNLQS